MITALALSATAIRHHGLTDKQNDRLPRQAALHGQLEVETLDVVKPETITALRQRLAGRRFDILFVVVGRKSQSLPSYLKETFTFVR